MNHLLIHLEAVLRDPAGFDDELVDRREAIKAALAEAGPGAMVVIAGKGHETTQTFADRVEDFDDVAVAAEVWAERGRTGGPR